MSSGNKASHTEEADLLLEKPLRRLSRVQMGLIIAVVFFGCAFLGGWWWSALVLASIYFGQQELEALMGNIGVKPSRIIVFSTAVLMVLSASLNKPQFISPVLTLAVIASFFRLLFRSPRAKIGDIGGTLIVVFYIIFLPVHFILLRHLGGGETLPAWQQPGLQYLCLLLSVISASDIAAYYVGRAFGKHLLYPEISPKKTREGAVGGLLGGLFLGVLNAFLWQLPLGHTLILSALLVVVGQLGDLTESMMKREVGLKDSGALLASHGGFLDRADSYVFSGIVCYYYIYWVMLSQGLAPEVIQWFQHLGASVNRFIPVA
ncbi:phosphatidate cytidylyltransferase [Vampirovibrio sp.]|uniref:phosphatidate cytidylyltransferase n=1 Tax=Vampirovibrio sp. TaxID=2717857 RepID=UPI003593982A